MRLKRRQPAVLEEIEAVYQSRYPSFLRVATAIVGDDQLAADAVHDGFVRAVRHRSSYRGEGSLEGWLWRTVVNAARKARPRAESGGQAEEGTCLEPYSLNGAGETVRAAISALPERQRLVLFLRYYADLDYRSIAQALDVKPGTIAATLNAAHSALRPLLKEVHL